MSAYGISSMNLPVSVDLKNGGLVDYINGLFDDFASSRQFYEEVWHECMNNYRGQYDPSLNWKKKEGEKGRSRIFIKITTLKCNTAHSKIIDAMFPGTHEVPFDCHPNLEFIGDLDPDIIEDAVKKFKDKLKNHVERIELQETLSNAILELCVLGSSVIKGPIITTSQIVKTIERKIGNIPLKALSSEVNPYEQVIMEEIVPTVELISLWDYYFDCNVSKVSDSIGEVHYMRMLPSNFRRLAGVGGYDKRAVLEASKLPEDDDYDDKSFEKLGDKYTGTQGPKDNRIPVKEYWGLIPIGYLKESGCKNLPTGLSNTDEIEALAVIANDKLIKACMNPLRTRRPFHVAPFKKVPHQVYGVGVAELMRDSQKMINSAARLLIDNKALSGNGVLGVNSTRIDMKKTGSLSLYAGKTIYVKGQFAPRDAIELITFPDVTRGLMELIELMERFADEETAIPKYTHGTQDTFLNKTATGMSMLMSMANLNLKTVLNNIDDYWIEPIVESFYDWFMEMDEDQSYKIPLKIKATGTSSLVAKELRMENIIKFMQIASSPQDAIFMDRIKMMKDIARILEIEDIMKSEEEIDAIMKMLSQESSRDVDIRERLDISKIFPYLTRNERLQILQDVGVQGDTSRAAPEVPFKIVEMENKQGGNG